MNFPPPVPASPRGFLAVTGDFTNPELRQIFLGEEMREGDESEPLPNPTTADGLANVAAIFAW